VVFYIYYGDRIVFPVDLPIVLSLVMLQCLFCQAKIKGDPPGDRDITPPNNAHLVGGEIFCDFPSNKLDDDTDAH
jgi:hypothetical protein